MTMDLLKELHKALAEQLLERVKSGECAAADFAAAAKFLKDNSVTVDPGTDKTLGELEEKLRARSKNRKSLSKEELDEVSNVVSISGRNSP